LLLPLLVVWLFYFDPHNFAITHFDNYLSWN
jgi:hypothetical protein